MGQYWVQLQEVVIVLIFLLFKREDITLVMTIENVIVMSASVISLLVTTNSCSLENKLVCLLWKNSVAIVP